MDDVFDLSKFDEYKEDNRREVKAAISSVWFIQRLLPISRSRS